MNRKHRKILVVLIFLTSQYPLILNAGTIFGFGNKPDSGKTEESCKCMRIQKRAEKEFSKLTKIKAKTTAIFNENNKGTKADELQIKNHKRKFGSVFKFRLHKKTRSKVGGRNKNKKNSRQNRIVKCPKTYSKR